MVYSCVIPKIQFELKDNQNNLIVFSEWTILSRIKVLFLGTKKQNNKREINFPNGKYGKLLPQHEHDQRKEFGFYEPNISSTNEWSIFFLSDSWFSRSFHVAISDSRAWIFMTVASKIFLFSAKTAVVLLTIFRKYSNLKNKSYSNENQAAIIWKFVDLSS